MRDLEAGARALDGRCADLRQAAAGAEARARSAAAEVLKANRIIEQLTARRALLHAAPDEAGRRGCPASAVFLGGRMLLVGPSGHRSVQRRDVQGRSSANSCDPVTMRLE